jgi:hypothetical protein
MYPIGNYTNHNNTHSNRRIDVDDNTLSLVKIAQEICNRGTNPRQATAHLLDVANSIPTLALRQADEEQAITELARRFSGYTIKPWNSV